MSEAPGAYTVFIDGVALWTPTLVDWPQAAAAFRSPGPLPTPVVPAPRPVPALLAANERRRAPDSVLLALQVAQAAVAMSGHAAHTLASVFTSAYGDLPIVDALCSSLASDPLMLSPTRFHHSVHNAASGYWAVASGSHASSTALAAAQHSFAAGLLEAAALCTAEQQPVLLVGYDTTACGPLASVNTSRGLLAVALVLAPLAGPNSRWRLGWGVAPADPGDSGDSGDPGDSRDSRDSINALDSRDSPDSRDPGDLGDPWTGVTAPRSAAAQACASNAMADALPLFEALARGQASDLTLALVPTLPFPCPFPLPLPLPFPLPLPLPLPLLAPSSVQLHLQLTPMPAA